MSPESIDYYSSYKHSTEPVGQVKKGVDKGLILDLGNTNRVQDQANIVRYKTHTIPSSKPADNKDNK